MEESVSNVEVCNLAYTGQFEELKNKILSDKLLACKTDQDHRTVLHWACSAGHTDIVAFLLAFGVDVDLSDDAGWTPLHIAASAGREEIVKALITRGAQLNVANENGCRPLHYAASKDRYEGRLSKEPNHVGSQKNCRVFIADCPDVIRERRRPKCYKQVAMYPLHRASAKGNRRLIQLLLKHSASTNIQDSEGNTALHLACDEERTEAAKLLVEHGASIYIENKEEKTPLQIAKGGLGALLRRIVEG